MLVMEISTRRPDHVVDGVANSESLLYIRHAILQILKT